MEKIRDLRRKRLKEPNGMNTKGRASEGIGEGTPIKPKSRSTDENSQSDKIDDICRYS